MTHWAYTLVPPVPDLPVPLPPVPLPPLPLPLPDPEIRLRRSRAARARAPEPLLLADAARQARVWFSKGASFDLIQARLNERCPQRPGWTRRTVRKLLLATGRIH
jgi:hypothetical protein